MSSNRSSRKILTKYLNEPLTALIELPEDIDDAFRRIAFMKRYDNDTTFKLSELIRDAIIDFVKKQPEYSCEKRKQEIRDLIDSFQPRNKEQAIIVQSCKKLCK